MLKRLNCSELHYVKTISGNLLMNCQFGNFNFKDLDGGALGICLVGWLARLFWFYVPLENMKAMDEVFIIIIIAVVVHSSRNVTIFDTGLRNLTYAHHLRLFSSEGLKRATLPVKRGICL